ncbi:MAG TPA: hypothetical protein VFX24_07340 [Ktedonobacterales bacterium]|nr:hypothetical protein [Ktedonobacterales bacterium]
MAEDNGQGANLEPEQQSGGMLKDPQSRRRFLRAAAIGTAGVAGVAGAVGVAQATGAPKVLKTFLGASPNASTPPPPPSIDGFFEETQPGPCITPPTYTGSSGQGGINRYVVFYIKNLPSGNYSFNVTQDIGSGAVALAAPGSGSATQPWEIAGPSQIHVVVYGANTEPTCPTDLTGLGTHAFSAFSVSIPSTDFTASNNDVAIYAHIQIDKSKVGSGKDIPTLPSSTTFTGTLSGDASQTQTVTANLV